MDTTVAVYVARRGTAFHSMLTTMITIKHRFVMAEGDSLIRPILTISCCSTYSKHTRRSIRQRTLLHFVGPSEPRFLKGTVEPARGTAVPPSHGFEEN